MKKILRIFALLLVLAALCGVSAAAVTIPEPDPVLLYVTDNANVLSTQVENDIADRNDILYAATGAQFAILTIDSLPAGYDSESYCYEVFNAWGIGSAEKNNGLLLLLVPPEGKFWMVAGTGLQSHLSGGVLSDLLDTYLADDFDAGRYDDGVTALFDAVWYRLEDIYGTIESTGSGYTPTPDHGYQDDSDAGALSILILLILVVVLVAICINARPGRKYYTGRPTPPPPSPGANPYYRTYRRPPTYMGAPPYTQYPRYNRTPRPPQYRPPSAPPGGGFGGASRPGSSFGGSRPSGGSSFGGGRSMGGGRSHGGGGGRR